MLNRPLVSVVIPAYNGDRFLAEAIQSVLDQRYEPLQLIVVDDGSTDDSAQVARSFPAVELIQQPNRGLSAARNAGVRAARGALLSFLDADDRWTAGKLDAEVRFLLAQPSVELVYGRTRQFLDSHCQTAINFTEYSDAPTASSLLIWRTAFERVGTFDETIRVGQYLDWHGRAVAKNLALGFLDQVVQERRIHDRNMGITLQAARPEYTRVLRAHLARRRSA